MRAGVLGWALLALVVGCSGVPAESDAGGDAGLPPADPSERWPGGETTVQRSDVGAYVQEAANLSILRRAAFEAGVQFFQLEWEPAPGRGETDGLGPTYNAVSCVACHARNGRGLRTLPHPGVLIRLGSGRGPDARYGGQVQPLSIPGVPVEARVQLERRTERRVPLDGLEVELVRSDYTLVDLGFGSLEGPTEISPRIAQQLVGLGLLEAIPVAALERIADPRDDDGDGISGRVARLDSGEVGRFGWKAAQPTVESQTAGAFAGDLGLTSRYHPTENCPVGQSACAAAIHGGSPELPDVRLEVTSAYVRLLGVPASRPSALADEGQAIFHRVGCGACHWASHVTGEVHEPELHGQRIWPYTDLLLHDMGEGLADGVPEGAAEGHEWRTPPLWGLGLVETVNGARHLLHDGRASSLEEAILWHGGEAEGSRDAYAALPMHERTALNRFVESL